MKNFFTKRRLIKSLLGLSLTGNSLFIANTSSAQFSSASPGGSAIQYNNAGINVGGNILLRNSGHLVFNNTSGHGVLDWGTGTSGNLYFRTLSTGGDINTKTDRMIILNNGSVGIGNVAPQTKLDVSGRLRVRAELGQTAGMWLTNLAGTVNRAFVGMTTDDNYVGFYGVGSSWKFVMNVNNGNVGIGVTNPQVPLAVNGLICAKEVRVALSGTPCWPDYVFSKDYRLKDLKEVEEFIKKNQHLPEIPSAKEVEANGVELGVLNAKLLQKVEELTLYIIEQDKKIDELNHQLNSLIMR